MQVKQYEIWIADLNPQIGAETGKVRPVLIIQTDLLNQIPHPSTLICPVTTNVLEGADTLRVHIPKGTSNLLEDSDIMIDQIRSIDNKRFIRKIGTLPSYLAEKVKSNISILLDME